MAASSDVYGRTVHQGGLGLDYAATSSLVSARDARRRASALNVRPFTVPAVARMVDPRGYDAGVADERIWQLAWLRERLGLSA